MNDLLTLFCGSGSYEVRKGKNFPTAKTRNVVYIFDLF